MTAVNDDNKEYSFKGKLYFEEDFVRNNRLTPLGVDYLCQFKRFSLFNKKSTAFLYSILLPVTIPLAVFRITSFFSVFGIGLLLKKFFSISLDNYPKLIKFIYFLCVGVIIKQKDKEGEETAVADSLENSDRCTVIISNHNARFDAMLLSVLHQSDTTYLQVAIKSFFGKLLVNSGLCGRSIEEGIPLDTKEGREEWRRRLRSGHSRSMLFFPEGRIVHAPKTILTFQNHLLYGQKVNIVCKKSHYQSFFLNHTQFEIPFYRPPYSRWKHKLLWDSIMEGVPFFTSLFTIFHTEVIGTLQLSGNETPEVFDELLYSLYFEHGYSLASLDQNLVKRLMPCLYL